MAAISGLMMFLWQGVDPVMVHDVHLMMIFDGILAIGFLCILLGFIVASVYAVSKVKEVETKMHDLHGKAHELVTKVTPIVEKTHDLLNDLSPKVKNISSDVEAISKTVREKVEEVGVTVTAVNRTAADVNEKTRHQVARVDSIVTTALTTTQELSRKVQQGIRYPIDQAAGLIAGLKAGFETLAKKSPLAKSKNVPNPYDL